MILKSLTLENFGVFRSPPPFQLEPRPSRPIILFGGKNGAGKSTLFEALRVCLYGPLALGTRVSRETYTNYLRDRIHSSPSLLIQPTGASVALEFQYADVEALHTYTVRRSWERKGNKLTEDLRVLRDGNLLDDVAEEHWQEFIRDLIPPGVSQLFFFDGEKIQQLAEDTTDQQALAEAVKLLLGLDVTERLHADLSLHLSRLIKLNGNGQFTREVDELEGEIAQLKKKLSTLQVLQKDYEKEVEEGRAAIDRVERRITTAGGTFARSRESLLKRRAELQARLHQEKDNLRQLCAGLLPFAVVPQLCHQLKDQLQREEQASQVEAGKALLNAAKEELLQRIDTHAVWSGLPRSSKALKTEIQNRLGTVIQESFKVEQQESVELVHQLSPPVQRRVLSWIDQATNDCQERPRTLAREIKKIMRNLNKVEAKLRQIPDDDVLKPFLEQLQELHRKLAEAGGRVSTNEEQIKAKESEIGELERRHEQTTERIITESSEASQASLAYNVQAALDEYKARLLEKKIAQLQIAFSECFQVLCRKKDILRRVSIDPKDFSVVLYDRKNKPFPTERLSAGEKQIYAISMLWALAKTSGRPLPVIIDTPLGRLDSDHRKLLVERYFPSASHQMLILSTDTEVDQQYFAELQPGVSQAYYLEFDSEEHQSLASSGYFWKRNNEAH